MSSAGTPTPGTTTSTGLATLDTGQTRALRLLDAVFLDWAHACGAQELTPPPLLSVPDAERLDILVNFPHLATPATEIVPQCRSTVHDTGEAIPAGALAPAQWLLPSSVCFGVYLAHTGTELAEDLTVTAFGRCFRNEHEYDGLRRLRSFQMREIVAIGSPEHVRETLARHSAVTVELAAALGIPVEREAAGDPFFDLSGPRALMQKLSPVKEEFVHDGLALASVNLHRNFFGERCAIRLAATGESAFTSCVGWGYERWLHALGRRHRGDWQAVCDNLVAAHASLPALPAPGSAARV
ncbi:MULTISPECIES: hypothetical protein [unclassified Streptomyces]|uniref:hypothetical protein n=1 Tax=unclassified Streptomyces TaxID=2593676 RepID=UPI002E2009A0|nr:hypothetical protein OG217_33025 [Streptomyces sp. NBC_01023]